MKTDIMCFAKAIPLEAWLISLAVRIINIQWSQHECLQDDVALEEIGLNREALWKIPLHHTHFSHLLHVLSVSLSEVLTDTTRMTPLCSLPIWLDFYTDEEGDKREQQLRGKGTKYSECFENRGPWYVSRVHRSFFITSFFSANL